jgi:hypothetical protein
MPDLLHDDLDILHLSFRTSEDLQGKILPLEIIMFMLIDDEAPEINHAAENCSKSL